MDLSFDIRVLLFGVALTIGTGLLFGLMPALYLSKPDLHSAIKQDSPGAGRSRRSAQLRGTLVGVQVALCMALMIAAGLLMRGLYNTYTVNPGFEYRNVAYLSLESWLDLYDSGELSVLRQRLMDGVKALPGVEAVAYADQEPLGDDYGPVAIRLPGESENESRRGEMNRVGPEYFSVLELPIVRGRAFSEADVVDRGTDTSPVIVTETTARNLWPDSDPIGRTVLVEGNALQVVGIASDAQVNALGEIDPYYVYAPGGGAVLLIRSRTDFGAIASGIRAAVRELDPTLSVRVFPLEATLGWWRGMSAAVTILGAGLGLFALVLASVGIYGVVSYFVGCRYREIGIRMALGAQSSNVVGMILRQTMRPVVIGAVIGIAGAVALSRILSFVLFGVSPMDPLGMGAGTLFVLVIALAAGILPARRAAGVDPSSALRTE